MKISQHMIVGIIGSLPVYFFTRSFEITSIYLVSNSLVDIDHFFDFWYDHGLRLSWRKFYQACGNNNLVHFIVFLHSFEVLFIILALLYVLRNSLYFPYMLGIFLGISCHLVSDVIYNKGISLKYFFL